VNEAVPQSDAVPDTAVLGEFADWLLGRGVPRTSAEQLLAHASVVQHAAGRRLFAAGEVPNTLYFVVRGLVRFYYLTPDGKEFNKNFVASGSVVTSLGSFLEGSPSPFFTEALEDCVFVTYPMELARQLTETDIVWERLVNGFITQLALKKERREASFLLDSAMARYEAFLTDFPEIALRVPQYHIASYLGITPVALSRIRGRRAGHGVLNPG
jgi:CRP-like cAMP-binding protein